MISKKDIELFCDGENFDNFITAVSPLVQKKIYENLSPAFRKIFIEEEENACFSVKMKHDSFSIPRLNSVPDIHVGGDELWVPTFEVYISRDMDRGYFEARRSDLVALALSVFVDKMIYEINKDAQVLLHASFSIDNEIFCDNFSIDTVNDFIDRGCKFLYVSSRLKKSIDKWASCNNAEIGSGLESIFIIKDITLNDKDYCVATTNNRSGLINHIRGHLKFSSLNLDDKDKLGFCGSLKHGLSITDHSNIYYCNTSSINDG